jgi:exopolyphosphatase/pppGpp-phosphohydrolase
VCLLSKKLGKSIEGGHGRTAEMREEHQDFVKPRAIDRAVVAAQLGRDLIGSIARIPRRCSYGQPQVVSTYPVIWHNGGLGRVVKPKPFPTVYWLTCPHVREAISVLESEGMIGEAAELIERDEDFRKAHECANTRYAAQRMALIGEDDLEFLEKEAPKMLRVLRNTGIGGVARFAGVKCLHMHVADYMAGNNNPVGDMAVSTLRQAGVWLECDGGRCVPARVAAINAGSNSTKVLVADVVSRLNWSVGSDGSVCSKIMKAYGDSGVVGVPRVFGVCMDARITGLGHGLGETGRLSEAGRAATVEAISDFMGLSRSLGADRVWVTATAAARAAEDSEALIRQVKEACEVRLEVVSPEFEAELSFLGVVAGAGSAAAVGSVAPSVAIDPRSLLIVDSGGMSTEFTRLDSCTGEVRSISLPLGAVSLTDEFLCSDPPSRGEIEQMRGHIRFCLEGAREFVHGLPMDGEDGGILSTIVVVGGSAVTLASIGLELETLDPDMVHGYALHREELEEAFLGLCSLACAERMQVKGMIQPERARVMPAGAAIILEVMDLAGAAEVVVSAAGILDGMAACIGLGRCGSKL